MASIDNELSAKWQNQVEGIWHGCPGIYDPEGLWQGYVQADRSIFVDDEGQHLIKVETKVNCFGKLRQRLETPVHLLRVKHHENKRVYEGPDFYGAGYPYGTMILGNDYCVPWQTDNRVYVQLLPGEQEQAYTNIAMEGNTVIGVITGIYKLSRDVETNPETQAMVAKHREDEIVKSKHVHLLPRYAAGHFEGEVETYTPDQKMVGTTKIRWRHEPHSQYRCSQNLELTGALNREIRMERTRHENHHFYEDGFYGNAVSFGRALFWRGNIKGETVRIIGRDFQLDGGDMAVAWEFWRADTLEHVVHGVLKWTPDA